MRPAALLILLAVVLAAPVAAQLPFDGCVDREDRAVRGIVRNDIGWAGVADLVNGEPVIYWNADANEHLSRPTQIFIYLHECAHHMLGHLWKPNALKWEMEADCWAAQLMWEGGMLRGQHIPVIERELRTTRGDEHHLGGERLMRALRECLDVKTDRDAWYAALTAFAAASRDGFAGIEGQAIPPDGRSGRFETELDLPGTYDCEITAARQVRCLVFAARDAKRTRSRYRELVKILRGWLPPTWTADEPAAASDGVAHSFVAEDGDRGTRIALVATTGNRIVFAMYPARLAEGAVPRLAPEIVEQRSTDAAPVPAADSSAPPAAPAAPTTPARLTPGMRVRVRVPQLARGWIRGWVTQTVGDHPCLAFELERTDAGGRTRYAFLGGVTAIEVDVRGGGAMVAGGATDAGDWVAFPLDAARAQDTGCRRR